MKQPDSSTDTWKTYDDIIGRKGNTNEIELQEFTASPRKTSEDALTQGAKIYGGVLHGAGKGGNGAGEIQEAHGISGFGFS
jgi:hypothetical protein